MMHPTPTPKELYEYAVDQATAVVSQVDTAHMDVPTPDSEWNSHDLLAHMVYELAWTADIVAGKTVAEVDDAYDGDLLGADAIAAWRRYAARTLQAVGSADAETAAHLSYRDTTVGEYLWEAGNDQLIHAWDLGQAIGVSVVFDETVARELYDRAYARRDELVGSGLFAAAISVPADANTQTKLLALLGRSETWASAT